MDLGLSGKVALVMGASRGLGHACAEALVDEGCAVAIAARGQERLDEAVKELSGRTKATVSGHTADASNTDDLERLVNEVQATHDGIDILVTNSGGPPAGAFADVTEEDWRAAYDVVVRQVVRLVRLVTPGMRERKWGRIVNIVSSSYREPVTGLVLSNAFRPAVVGLAKTLSAELGPFGITVNNIAPGRFDTERLRSLAARRAKTMGGSVDEWMDRFRKDSPLGRTGEPRELGDVAAFLASDRARFVTGVTVPVDGGLLKSL